MTRFLFSVVWSVVRRFDQPQRYKPFVSRCSVMNGELGIGSVREVNVKSGLPTTTSTERLELLDDEEHILGVKFVGGDHRLKDESDYCIVATPLLFNNTSLSPFAGVGALHYMNSNSQVQGPLPAGPDPFDMAFSINQAKSIRAARPNPQGTFNVSNVNITQTFILETSQVVIGNKSVYAVNNFSYFTPNTPLKLTDYFVNGSNGQNLLSHLENIH
ncbi:monocopper oxidase-like protein SKU5 isoform X2 [Euphorbia lathyris]|uniref:monocopper oxidase-like protein SKU5 isoform X2 n=1 Tax=Euphorbia lathyris TaxID=212925 RepID=UPI003313F018